MAMNPAVQNDAPDTGKWRARRLDRGLRGLIGEVVPWMAGPVRPGEVINGLRRILLDRSGLVEDANYHKYTPNHFVVELGEGNYQANYQPIEEHILQQWHDRMQEHLSTTNSRQGRLVYRLGGPLKVEIRPSPRLSADEARILYRLDPTGGVRQLAACLERPEDGRRWRLYEGLLSLGRDPSSDLVMDNPRVQSARLVSGQHAYLVCEVGHVLLFDGDPGGKPSRNGTYVNGQRVSPGGVELRDGDTILLAALKPDRPDPNTPGVAMLRFIENCG